MSNTVESEFGWDDEIENDGTGFVLLPEGDYGFTVESFERGRYGGSAKVPPCNQAILKIGIDSPQGHATLNCNLFLHSKFEWKLCQFFTSIGQRKHGEKLRMNWQTVIGAKGRCKVTTRKWTKDNGEEAQSNEIAEFYEPSEGEPALQAQSKWGGAF